MNPFSRLPLSDDKLVMFWKRAASWNRNSIVLFFVFLATALYGGVGLNAYVSRGESM